MKRAIKVAVFAGCLLIPREVADAPQLVMGPVFNITPDLMDKIMPPGFTTPALK